MARPISKVAPDWWDYTTLDPHLLADAARLTPNDLLQLARDGFEVAIYDTLEEFYCAEALEYIRAWQQATPDNPVGICGPIGPTEQLPLVARIVNALGVKLHHAHFWGMDEWIEDGKPVPMDHPLSFAKADMDLCFNRICRDLRMPDANIHFPVNLEAYSNSFDQVRCAVMQGGQGEVKHWAFNDPPKREGEWQHEPPPPGKYLQLNTRITDLHPMTVIQNARTSGGGYVPQVPTRAATVGPMETWKADCVSIWHPGHHDNPFGIRLTALMISKRVPDTSVPMSLLADHTRVKFNYYRGGIGTVEAELHQHMGGMLSRRSRVSMCFKSTNMLTLLAQREHAAHSSQFDPYPNGHNAMKNTCRVIPILILARLATISAAQTPPTKPAISPTDNVIRLFDGRTLGDCDTWLKDTKHEDPRQVFRVTDGLLHVTGDGLGGLITRDRYRNYHLVLEYRWGDRTWHERENSARDSGLLIHSNGKLGGYQGIWMPSIEVQIIEGGVGDFVPVGGPDESGKPVILSLTANVGRDRDDEVIWKEDGPRETFRTPKMRRINWFGRDPDWKDEKGIRGPQDKDSPHGQWTRIDVLSDDGHIQTFVNGVKVNETFDASPREGRIQLQSELAEIFFRRWELWPLGKGPKIEAAKQ